MRKINSPLNSWLAQRLTAFLMVVFTVVLFFQIVLNGGDFSYYWWAGIFAFFPMKLLTFSVLLALAWHVVLGMKEIYIDYIKPVALRIALKLITFVWVAACIAWAFQILWRL